MRHQKIEREPFPPDRRASPISGSSPGNKTRLFATFASVTNAATDGNDLGLGRSLPLQGGFDCLLQVMFRREFCIAVIVDGPHVDNLSVAIQNVNFRSKDRAKFLGDLLSFIVDVGKGELLRFGRFFIAGS